MKYTKYSRYAPGAADDIDIQDLMDRLSDFFLQSGFESQYGFHEMDMERSRQQHLDQLREAILRALQESDLIPPELLEKLRENPDLSQNQDIRNMIDQIIERMEEEGPFFTLGDGETFEDMIFSTLTDEGAIHCPECGQAAPDGAKFCDRCGQGLAKAAAPKVEYAIAALEPGTVVRGEFRIVEVIGRSALESRYRAERTGNGAGPERVQLRERPGPTRPFTLEV